MMGKLADESDGVDQNRLIRHPILNPPHPRVQRRKEFVLGIHILTRQSIKQRRFSRVRVANERDAEAVSGRTLRLTGSFDLVQVFLETLDPCPYESPVDLELRLTDPACTDPACLA